MRGSQCHAAGARPVCDLPLPVKRYPPPPPTVIGRRPSTAPREYKRPLVCLNLPGEHDPRNPLGVVLGKSRAMPRNTRDTTGLPLPEQLVEKIILQHFSGSCKKVHFFYYKKMAISDLLAISS